MSEQFRAMRTASRSAYPWLQAEDELLDALIRSRLSASSISVILQRTTRAVRRRAEVLTISWKAFRAQPPFTRAQPKLTAPLRWKPEEEQLLSQLIASGYCENNVAQQLGRSVYSIRIRASKLKMSLNVKNRKHWMGMPSSVSPDDPHAESTIGKVSL